MHHVYGAKTEGSSTLSTAGTSALSARNGSVLRAGHLVTRGSKAEGLA